MSEFAEPEDWLDEAVPSSSGGGTAGKGGKKSGKGKKKGKKSGKKSGGAVDSTEPEEELDEEELTAKLNDETADASVTEKLQNVLDQHSKEDHDFWSTQPVASLTDVFEGKVGESGPVDGRTDLALVRDSTLDMPEGFVPAGFEWCSVDVTVEEEIKDLYGPEPLPQSQA